MLVLLKTVPKVAVSLAIATCSNKQINFFLLCLYGTELAIAYVTMTHATSRSRQREMKIKTNFLVE